MRQSKNSMEKETFSAIKETNDSDDFSDPDADARYDALLKEFEDVRKESTDLRLFFNQEKLKAESLDSENKRLKLEIRVLQSQNSHIGILEKENLELKQKLEIYETSAQEESIE
jgi:hypothetical protein